MKIYATNNNVKITFTNKNDIDEKIIYSMN